MVVTTTTMEEMMSVSVDQYQLTKGKKVRVTMDDSRVYEGRSEGVFAPGSSTPDAMVYTDDWKYLAIEKIIRVEVLEGSK